MLETVILTITLAVLPAITAVAFKAPSAFRKVRSYLVFGVLGIVLAMIFWRAAVLHTELLLFPFLDEAKKPEARKVVEDSLPNILAWVIYGLSVAVYLIALLPVREIIKMGERQENEQG